MKKLFPLLVIVIIAFVAMTPPNFFAQQLSFPRVKEAQKDKGAAVAQMLSSKNINADNFDLFIRAFKKEQKLEIWAKSKGAGSYSLLKTYDFCATTGVLGPKRRSGDRQIPEGFYKVNFFNPQSQYHLSFRIDYPNKSDLVFADKINPGDNIFIHGQCVTIGCIPVGDENIKEIYLLAAKAKSCGGALDVHIFPANLSGDGYQALRNEYASNSNLLDFWANLKPGFDAFETSKVVPTIDVNEAGKYMVK